MIFNIFSKYFKIQKIYENVNNFQTNSTKFYEYLQEFQDTL